MGRRLNGVSGDPPETMHFFLRVTIRLLSRGPFWSPTRWTSDTPAVFLMFDFNPRDQVKSSSNLMHI